MYKERYMECKLNLKMAIKNDYLLGLLLIAPISFSVVGGVLIATKAISPKVFLELPFKELPATLDFRIIASFSLIIVVTLILFAKRVLYIKSFENEYRTVDAKVVDINYVKDRCGVDVEFNFNGKSCSKHFMLFNNKQTRYVHMDSEVKLIIKNENPKKCLIKDLYFD